MSGQDERLREALEDALNDWYGEGDRSELADILAVAAQEALAQPQETAPAAFDALLPCPFCGGKASIVKNSFPPWRHPSCETENCPGHVTEQDEQGGTNCDCATDEEAISLWNRRAAGRTAAPAILDTWFCKTHKPNRPHSTGTCFVCNGLKLAAPATAQLSEEQVRELTSKLGTAVALFTMEYTDAKALGRHLDHGVDSVIEPILREALHAR